MSVPKDQAGLLGSLIPNVYVDTITLETGGKPPVLSDPHVEHEWETPQSSNETDVGTTRVVIDTSIKEIISDDSISNWFGDKFARYVKLTILVSDHPAVTHALSTSNDAINIINKDFVPDSKEKSVEILKKAFPKDIHIGLQEHTQISEFNIYNDALADELDLTQHSSEVDDDGNIIHDVNFRASFSIVGEEPAHLAVFAMTHLDMKQLIEDYNLSVDSVNLDAHNGKVSSEIVVDSGKVVSQAFVFTKRNGKAWLGPVHEDSGQWATGDYPSPESVPLIFSRVSNDKVQDFRNVNKLERLNVDLSPLENDVLSQSSKKFKFLKRDNNRTQPRNVYFSDLYLARDRFGNARMSFAIDYLRMLSESSAYEKIYSTANKQQKKEMASSCKIRSLRVMRRRISHVDTMNRLGNPVVGEVLFDKKEAPTTVASSGESSFGVFNETSTTQGSVRESFYVLKDQSEVPRFFTAVDFGVSQATDGMYQYGVEMVVEDASQKYIFSLIRKLRMERQRLLEYYQESTKVGMSKYVVELQDPHTDSKWERAAIRRGNDGGNFSITSGRFTNQFIQGQYSLYEDDLDKAPWVSSLVTYFEVLNIFTGLFNTEASIMDLVSSVGKFACPRSGSPKGVMAIIKMMDNLTTRASMIVGSDVPLGEGESKLYKSAGSSSSSSLPTKTTTITHWFSETSFDSNVVKNVGWDYLSSSKTQRYNGLRFVTGGEYRSRVDLESKKYFANESAPIDIKGVTSGDTMMATAYGYLSPAKIVLPAVEIPVVESSNGTTNDIISEDQYSSIEASIASISTSPTPTMPPALDQKSPLSPEAQLYQVTALEQFAQFNITMMPADAELPEPLNTRVVATDAIVKQPRLSCSSITGAPADTSLDPVVSRVDEGVFNATGLQNVNANSFLLQVQHDLRVANSFYNGSTKSPFGTGINNTVSSSPKTGMTSTTMQTGTIRSFNVNNQTNVVNWMQKTEGYLKDVAVHHGVQPNSVSYVTRMLPIQIKSLLLASTNPSAVVEDWHSYGYDPVSDPRTSSRFAFMYNLINRVEVLVGYEQDIKMDQWEPLTHEYWVASTGREMVCRMKPYQCKLFGINRPKTLEMPIYDEYFILKPAVEKTTTGTVTPGTTEIHDSSKGIYDYVTGNGGLGMREYDGIGAATSTNVVGTSASPPCGDMFRKVSMRNRK